MHRLLFSQLLSVILIHALCADPIDEAKQRKTDRYRRVVKVGEVAGNELLGVCSVVVSPDGRHAYAAARDAAILHVYKRDVQSGAIKTIQSLESKNDLRGVLGLRITPDGRYVVTTSFLSKTVTLFERDPMTGRLTRRDVAREGEGRVRGMTWVFDCSISPDSQFIYISSSNPIAGEPSPNGSLTSFRIGDRKLHFIETNGGKDGCFLAPIMLRCILAASGFTRRVRIATA